MVKLKGAVNNPREDVGNIGKAVVVEMLEGSEMHAAEEIKSDRVSKHRCTLRSTYFSTEDSQLPPPSIQEVYSVAAGSCIFFVNLIIKCIIDLHKL
jgi:hypothetical protein